MSITNSVSVTITISGVEYKILCDEVKISYKPIIIAKPNANNNYPVEAQTQGIENPIYTLTNVIITEDSGTLTMNKLLDIIKFKYDGTNTMTLKINYGISSDKYYTAIDGTTTEIKVVPLPTTVSIPLKAINNSSGKFLAPYLNLSFMETA